MPKKNTPLALVAQTPTTTPVAEIYRFDAKEYRLFLDVMRVQSKSGDTRLMRQFIKRKMREFGAHTVWSKDGNVYGIKGQSDLYPCMVAHTDTVHPIIAPENYVVGLNSLHEWWAWNPNVMLTGKDGKQFHQPVGIGGDDKVGIYIALNMMRTHPAMKCAFFRDEEVGCVGAGLADMAFFEDTTLVLECDRRGTKEWVNRIGGTPLQSPEFEKAVKPILDEWGFKNANGMMTDVQALKRNGLKVCCANIACGYYDPHGPGEYIVEHDVLVTQMLVEDIITTLGAEVWPHVYTAPVYTQRTYEPYDWKAREKKLHDELVAMGYIRSADGFYYRYRGPGDDPLRQAQILLALDEKGQVQVVPDPKSQDASQPTSTQVGVTNARTHEQAYCRRLEEALRREHPEWSDAYLLAVVQGHYDDMKDMAKIDVLDSLDVKRVFLDQIEWAQGNPLSTAEPPNKPSHCGVCGNDGDKMLWDGFEDAWGCVDCQSYTVAEDVVVMHA